MASGDIIPREGQSATGSRGARLYNVASGTPIYAGEPVQVGALGNAAGVITGSTTVMPALTSTPDASAHLYVGIASTNSSNTSSAAGTVDVIPLTSADTWLANPDAPTTWDTQAEYNALVGARVVLKNSVSVTATPTSGTYTILASDSSNNGCVVLPLDVFLVAGKVAFAFRAGCSYLS